MRLQGVDMNYALHLDVNCCEIRVRRRMTMVTWRRVGVSFLTSIYLTPLQLSKPKMRVWNVDIIILTEEGRITFWFSFSLACLDSLPTDFLVYLPVLLVKTVWKKKKTKKTLALFFLFFVDSLTPLSGWWGNLQGHESTFTSAGSLSSRLSKSSPISSESSAESRT